MEKKYSEVIGVYKLKKLNTWRSRYSEQEYPYKVALNLLYDLLVVEKVWNEIQISIEMAHLGWGNTNFQNFHEAHGYVLNRSDSIAGSTVRPGVVKEYKTREKIANFNWASTRERVLKAQNGDNKEVQKIELAYYYFTCGVELIYAWLALRFIGTDMETAFLELTGLSIPGIDYNLYESLLNGFGKASGIYYKPLPKLFRDAGVDSPYEDKIFESGTKDNLYSILN
jgi:hypothetical protein